MSKKVSQADQDLIASFLASNSVTVIEEGVKGLDLTEREWSKRVCQPYEQRTYAELIAETHVVVDHMGRELVRNGLGERIS